jgi:DNA mismatch endonuclease (patch repair protein)
MMADVVSKAKRSEMMAGIKGKNTKPEIVIRKALHRQGFRYKLHDKTLPGKPDLVFPKYKAVIEVNGCFWHLHNCHLFKWPKSKKEFWKEKLTKNKERDERNQKALEAEGWRLLVVWECALKGKGKLPLERVITECVGFLKGDQIHHEIKGIY